jgi:hypothetical protein
MLHNKIKQKKEVHKDTERVMTYKIWTEIETLH